MGGYCDFVLIGRSRRESGGDGRGRRRIRLRGETSFAHLEKTTCQAVRYLEQADEPSRFRKDSLRGKESA